MTTTGIDRSITSSTNHGAFQCSGIAPLYLSKVDMLITINQSAFANTAELTTLKVPSRLTNLNSAVLMQ